MQSRRIFLSQLAAAAVAATFKANAQALLSSPLREAASSRDILFGCATTNFELRQSDFAQALAREASIVVPEYELKRNLVEPARGRFDFSAADGIATFAGNHRMKFRGHPLVWHKANPPWLDDALAGRRAENLLIDYVRKSTAHFAGRCHSWDVVNEAIEPGQPQNLRQTPWLKMFGPSYIDTAFHVAREADPDALLVYNDWGCEAAGENHDRFRAATLRFLEGALRRGVPIQAYGMQGHLQAFGHDIDQTRLRAFLDAIKSLGLKLLVTELDVDDHGGPEDVTLRDRKVADMTRGFLDVVLDCNTTMAVLTWGLSDRYIQPPYEPVDHGWKARMLPLDDKMNRKPMWQAMSATFAASRRR